jgi:hypothetical protein
MKKTIFIHLINKLITLQICKEETQKTNQYDISMTNSSFSVKL